VYGRGGLVRFGWRCRCGVVTFDILRSRLIIMDMPIGTMVHALVAIHYPRHPGAGTQVTELSPRPSHNRPAQGRDSTIHGRAVSPIPDRCDRARRPQHTTALCPLTPLSCTMQRSATSLSVHALSLTPHRHARACAQATTHRVWGRGPRPPHMSDDRPIRKSPRDT